MLLSIIFSLICRKKWILFWGFLSIGVCTVVFFSASIKKEMILKQYTAKIPKFSEQDIFILSNKSIDILKPEAFIFPHMEKIISHEDVLGVSALSVDEDHFFKAGDSPELLIISLKKDVSSKKWIDTFEAQSEYVAIHSSQFRNMYNKAIIIRNKALHDHFSLLSYIILFSFLGMIIFSINTALKLQKEISTLLAEGLKIGSLVLGFGFCLSKIAAIISFCIFSVSLFYLTDIGFLFRLYIGVCLAQSISIFGTIAVVLILKRRGYGQNRIL